MLSYLSSFWTSDAPAAELPQQPQTQTQAEPPSQTQQPEPTQAKPCCWVLRGMNDQHSSKCKQPINGTIGVFDSLDGALKEAGWLALFTGCVHLRLGRVPLNELALGKPIEVLSLRELKAGPGEGTFQAVFVQDGPSISSIPLELAALEAWLSSNGLPAAEKRVADIREAIAANNWHLWSFGANDALLFPVAVPKQKTD